MTKSEVAAYCAVTPRCLDDWIRQGIVPGPLPGTHCYDRRALDAALDRASGLAEAPGEPEDAWEAWERTL